MEEISGRVDDVIQVNAYVESPLSPPISLEDNNMEAIS